MDVIYPLKEIKRCKTGGKPIKRGGNMRHNFAKKQKKAYLCALLSENN